MVDRINLTPVSILMGVVSLVQTLLLIWHSKPALAASWPEFMYFFILFIPHA